MAEDSPDRYLLNMAKKQRTGRIFLDYLRNDRMSTAVAPLSPRLREGAPVSMPLNWSQVKAGLDPTRYTVRTAPALIAKSTAWQDYCDAVRPLEPAIRKLVEPKGKRSQGLCRQSSARVRSRRMHSSNNLSIAGCLIAAPLLRAAVRCVRCNRQGRERDPSARMRGQGRACALPLRRSRGLDEVAREWSKGGRLRRRDREDRLSRLELRLDAIEGAKNEKALLQIVASNYCQIVLNAEFTEIGVYERGDSAWIVVAVPKKLPTADDMPQVAARVLELVNEARAKPRKCGSRRFEPAPPLTLSTDPVARRAGACEGHEREQASSSIAGPTAASPRSARPAPVTTGRRSRRTLRRERRARKMVVQGWLDSPGHCVNIMGPQYREMGLAYFTDFAHKGEIYWAQEFGTQKGK